MPGASQPVRQWQDPWSCPLLRELPLAILVGWGQPGLKRKGHLEDPGTPCSVNSGREGAHPRPRSLSTVAGWEVAGVGVDGQLEPPAPLPLSAPYSAGLPGPLLRPSRGTSALKETAAVCQGLDPPPHVQGHCQELGEAASGFQLPTLCLSQPWSLAGESSLQ